MHAEKTICLSNYDFREFWSKSAKYNNVTAILGTSPLFECAVMVK